LEHPSDRHIILIENILFGSSLDRGGIDLELISIVDEYIPKLLDRIREDIANNQQMSARVREAKIHLASNIAAWVNHSPIPPPKLF